jgi:hypothetical protein
VEATIHRTRGHGCITTGSALEGTRLNGIREFTAGFVRTQLAAHVHRRKEDAMTSPAASRRSRSWSSWFSRAWPVVEGRVPFSHRPALARASGVQTRCATPRFATAGT